MIRKLLENLKKSRILKKSLELLCIALFTAFFLGGVVFVAETVQTVSKKVYAEPVDKVVLPDKTEGKGYYRYERIYAGGNYYMVFWSVSGTDIEVVPLY